MKKSHIATLLIFLLVIPATLYFGCLLYTSDAADD